jgi:hypothetical protein
MSSRRLSICTGVRAIAPAANEVRHKEAAATTVKCWLAEAASRPEITTRASGTQSEFLCDRFIELDGAMGQQAPEAALSLSEALCTALLKLSTGAHKLRQSADVTMSYIVELVCTVRTSLKLYSSSLTPQHARFFATALEQVDLWDLASKLRTALRVLPARHQALEGALSSSCFQLTHMGPRFIRKVDSSNDDRVSFMPDRWQKDMLDAVDRRESLLVIAPTSSGTPCYESSGLLVATLGRCNHAGQGRCWLRNKWALLLDICTI